MSSETFLSRWSRRKREVREPTEGPDRMPPAPADLAGDLAGDLAEGEAAAAAPAPDERPAGDPAGGDELSPDEIARLPSVDELTADMDLSLFLRKGVPDALRKAALRRMWSLDPKIRDFVCEAREYAYDWNVPGGVPGSGGALPPADEVRKLAEQIVGGHRPAEARSGEPEGDAIEPAPNSVSRGDAEAHAEAPASSPPDSSGPDRPANPQPLLQEPSAAMAERAQPDAISAGEAASPRRRHGGARPC